jgi:hypothetical protein
MKSIPLYHIKDLEAEILFSALEEIEDGNILLALHHFDKSLKTEGPFVSNYTSIEKARLLLALGKAEKSYEIIIETQKNKFLNSSFELLLESYIIKAESEHEIKKYNESIKSNTWIIDNTENGEIYNIDAYFRRGLSHAYLGRNNLENLFKAEEDISHAIRFGYDYFADITLSEILIKLNEKDDAIKLLLNTQKEILSKDLNEELTYQLLRIEENLVRLKGGERKLRNYLSNHNLINQVEVQIYLDEII